MDRRAVRPRNSGGRFVMLTPAQREALLAAAGPRVCARCGTTSTTQWRFWVPPPPPAAPPPGKDGGDPTAAVAMGSSSGSSGGSRSGGSSSTGGDGRGTPPPPPIRSSPPTAHQPRVLLCNACGISLKRRTRRTISAPGGRAGGVPVGSPPATPDIRKPRVAASRRRVASSAATAAAVATAAAGAAASRRLAVVPMPPPPRARAAPGYRPGRAASSGLAISGGRAAPPQPPWVDARPASGTAAPLSIASLLADDRRCYYSDLGESTAVTARAMTVSGDGSGRSGGGGSGSGALDGGDAPLRTPRVVGSPWQPPSVARWPTSGLAAGVTSAGSSTTARAAAAAAPSHFAAAAPQPGLAAVRRLPPLPLPLPQSLESYRGGNGGGSSGGGGGDGSAAVAAPCSTTGLSPVPSLPQLPLQSQAVRSQPLSSGYGSGVAAAAAAATAVAAAAAATASNRGRAAVPSSPAAPRLVLAPLQYVPRRPYVPPSAPALSPTTMARLWQTPPPGEGRLAPSQWR